MSDKNIVGPMTTRALFFLGSCTRPFSSVDDIGRFPPLSFVTRVQGFSNSIEQIVLYLFDYQGLPWSLAELDPLIERSVLISKIRFYCFFLSILLERDWVVWDRFWGTRRMIDLVLREEGFG